MEEKDKKKVEKTPVKGEKEEKKEEVKKPKKKKMNWNLVIMLFLFGLILALPMVFTNILPVVSGKMINMSNNLFVLQDDGTILRMAEKEGEFTVIERIELPEDMKVDATDGEIMLLNDKIILKRTGGMDVFKFSADTESYKYDHSEEFK